MLQVVGGTIPPFDGSCVNDPPLTENETGILESMVLALCAAYPDLLIETKWIGRGLNVTILPNKVAGKTGEKWGRA